MVKTSGAALPGMERVHGGRARGVQPNIDPINMAVSTRAGDQKSGFAFRQRSCAHFGWRPEEYEDLALRKCLYPLANLLYPLICRFSPRYFQSDKAFLRDIGSIHDWEQLKMEYQAWCGHEVYEQTPARKLLRLRISGQRFLALGWEIFSIDDQKGRGRK